MRPILIFGGTGQVGRELLIALRPIAPIVAPTHAETDIARPSDVREMIGRIRPSLIVNAAALTNVDRAEREPGLARALNEIAPGVIAEAAVGTGSTVIHYSTDYVFDGEARAPYTEAAVPHPINVYGMTKLGGERRVSSAGAPHLIIRTSWVYSEAGSGFVPTLLRQLRTQAEVRVVSDQVGSPTWSRSLASATAEIARAIRRGDSFPLSPDDCGVYHLGGSGAASRLEIAQEVIASDPFASEHVTRALVPVAASEFGAVARRPRYSALANERAARRFGVVLRPWRAELREMLASRGH
jgi:dTDP-4-dehydrorhamnose reductase